MEMKMYRISFTGSCEICAKSEEKAEKRFWDKYIDQGIKLPRGEYDVQEIEEMEE